MVRLTLWLVASALFTLHGRASANAWEKCNGPEGGEVFCIAECAGMLFAGTYGGGIYRSGDDGASWQEASNGLDSKVVRNIVSIDDTLFAGTWYSGIYRSTDLGQSWQHAYFDTLNMDLEIHYLGVAARTLFASTSRGSFLRSKDGGRTWVDLNNRTGVKPFYWISSLTVDGEYLYLASDQGWGIIRTRDLGETWESLNSGLIDSSIYSLATRVGTVYAGTYASGILFSKDGGKTWIQNDSGMSETGPPSGGRRHIVDDILVMPDRIFAATGDGLFLSETAEGRWEKVLVSDIVRLAVNRLVVTERGRLIAGTPCGIYCSADSARNWQACSKGIWADIIESISVYSEHLVAGSYYWRVHSTTDKGRNWRCITPNPTVASPTMTFASDSCLYVGGYGESILRTCSTDFFWEPFNQNIRSGITGTVLSIADLDTFLFASGEGGVLRRASRDTSWADISGPLTSGARSLASGNGRLFSAGAQGIWVTDDYGATWQNKVSVASGGFKSIVVRNGLSFAAWASGTSGSIYRSFDNGNSWQEMPFALPRMEELMIKGDSLYAATNGFGVFASYDSARSWSQINAGLTNPFVLSLAASDSFLYAGTCGSSVYRLALSANSEIRSGLLASNLGPRLEIHRISPGKYMVGYSIADRGPVRLSFYDLSGRRRALVAEGTRTVGEHSAVVNLPAFTGCAIVTLEAGAARKARAVCLIR